MTALKDVGFSDRLSRKVRNLGFLLGYQGRDEKEEEVGKGDEEASDGKNPSLPFLRGRRHRKGAADPWLEELSNLMRVVDFFLSSQLAVDLCFFRRL